MASATEPKRIVIVESPTKASTISRFLGADFVVESSRGHVRDLPTKASEIPKAYRSEPWARLGIDVENDFKALYVTDRAKKDKVADLKALVARADELYLATDEDREGEAIAWHLLEVLSPPARVQVRRLVFHEITPDAIRAALDNPREIDRRLVDAQEARRLLDRLYGYEVSPVLWKKVAPRLSAGRVQSVATRIVVERERERMAFTSAGYWSLRFRTTPAEEGHRSGEGSGFTMAAVALDGRRLATGRDFGPDGKPTGEVVVLQEAGANGLAEALDGATATVTSVSSKPYRRRPAPPFITSTLQQEAGRRLRISSSEVMRAAQTLYEKGFITYMRTDSVTLADVAVAAARAEVAKRFGAEFLPAKPRRYRSKVRNAQEAHEAIRPAGESFTPPESLRGQVAPTEARLYELIWRRTLASQMTDATGETITCEAKAHTPEPVEPFPEPVEVTLSASGTVISHEGFRRVMQPASSASKPAGAASSANDRDDGEPEGDPDEAMRLPRLAEGDMVSLSDPQATGHQTQPPARYTEATLVRRLEELGVGRPSTYASIITTISDRGYVTKRGTALVPTFTAFSVVNLLEGHFDDYVDYAFTARMEDALDEIAGGRKEYIPWLHEFYFGGEAAPGLKGRIEQNLEQIDVRAVNSVPLGEDSEGRSVEVRLGRFGPYVSCGDKRASLPEGTSPDDVTMELASELLARPATGLELGSDPETGLPVTARSGRYGPYVQLGPATDEPDAKATKIVSLLDSMSLDTLTLEDALRLLSLPRTVGVDPADGVAITTQLGRYGPYLKKGSETRSLASADEIFTVDLERCLELLSQPRRRRGGEPKAPLRELGPDPVTDRPLVVRDGRYGPYVTDGETNASLRGGDTPESITPQRASDLLAARRDAPARPGRKRSRGSRGPKGS